MKTLCAGVWLGEFGFELFDWQAYVRTVAKEFDRILVSSRPGNEVLYADFCDEYRPYATPLYSAKPHENLYGEDARELTSRVFKDVLGADTKVYLGTVRSAGKLQPTYVSYGNKHPHGYFDIVYHARMMVPKRHPGDDKEYRTMEELGKLERNWPEEKWKQLAEHFRGLKTCSVGTCDSALHVPGSLDLRGLPLSGLADILASSRMIVGPSSGVMHFATLCRCSQVVWLGEHHGGQMAINRYQKEWNPFQTPTHIVYRKGWQHTVEDAELSIRRALDGVWNVVTEPTETVQVI